MNANDVQPVGSPTTQGNNPQTIVIVQSSLGPESARMTCPKCHQDISTVVKKEPSTMAYISGFCLALFG